MKLTSTLSPNSKAGSACGDLHLFFSLRNLDDIPTTGSSRFWNCSGKGACDTYKLKSGEVIRLQLDLRGDQIPGQLYVMGAIYVTARGGVEVGPQLTGIKAPPAFLSTKAHIELLSGESEFDDGKYKYQMGFYLSVPWDRQSADCKGRWWACWQPVPHQRKV